MREGDFRVYVQDILEAIKRIEEYLEGLTFEEFSRTTRPWTRSLGISRS
jgi:uncharacterized protein with HEPN domain